MALVPDSKRILLVGADDAARSQVAATLGEAGYRVTTAATREQATAELAARGYDAVIGSLDGGEAHRELLALKRQAGTTPLLVLCEAGQVRTAIQAMRKGVEDYVVRPPDPFELRTRLERILERHELDSRIAFFQDELSKKGGVRGFEARSAAMRQVLERVMRVAPLRTTVLITGESGAGKELVARSIHFNSPRTDHPFIALNCAAIPGGLIESELFGHERGSFTGAHARARGKFEIAHRGTLFLDEIGEMDRATQAKLLRVLEQREFMRVGGDHSIRVDVRVIAATNADLEELVEVRQFRRDLYYRLKVVTIRVPPLRERREDIPPLAELFLDQLARSNAVPRKTITARAMAALREHGWPGNVRELKNLLESALVSTAGGAIGVEDLPAPLRGRQGAAPRRHELAAGTTLAEMERELIRSTLEHTGGNRTHSAELLGIGVRTLQRKMRSYGIRIPSRRRRPRATRRD